MSLPGPSTSSSRNNNTSKKLKDESVTEYKSVLDAKKDKALIQALQHIDTFYEKKPKDDEEDDEKPEDSIPDAPENAEAREFLAKAPKKGLWMPLGKEVKVMQCWKCKAFGHRSGDKECPLFLSGSLSSEQFRFVHEDPMYQYVSSQTKDKEEKVKQLEALLRETTSEDSSDDSHHKSKRKKKKKHKKKVKKRKKSDHH